MPQCPALTVTGTFEPDFPIATIISDFAKHHNNGKYAPHLFVSPPVQVNREVDRAGCIASLSSRYPFIPSQTATAAATMPTSTSLFHHSFSGSAGCLCKKSRERRRTSPSARDIRATTVEIAASTAARCRRQTTRGSGKGVEA